MGKPKDVLTTGQVAKICNVAPRTVSKWFDTGQLRGYRIPGSKDRRIPRQHLIRFMKAHGMPLEGMETGATRVLVADPDEELLGVLRKTLEDEYSYDVRTASGTFEAGAVAESFRPHVIVVDVSFSDMDAKRLCRHVRTNPALQETRLIATGGAMTDGQGQGYLQQGFDAYLKKPFEVRPLVTLIEKTGGNSD
jgi:excisionase family DNA binding protein